MKKYTIDMPKELAQNYPILDFIDEVIIEKDLGVVVDVVDVNDGNSLRIEKQYLKLV